jgi:hypothetical protein
MQIKSEHVDHRHNNGGWAGEYLMSQQNDERTRRPRRLILFPYLFLCGVSTFDILGWNS